MMSLQTTETITFPMILLKTSPIPMGLKTSPIPMGLKTSPTPMGLNPGFLLIGMSRQARNPSSDVYSSSVQSFLVVLACV